MTPHGHHVDQRRKGRAVGERGRRASRRASFDRFGWPRTFQHPRGRARPVRHTGLTRSGRAEGGDPRRWSGQNCRYGVSGFADRAIRPADLGSGPVGKGRDPVVTAFDRECPRADCGCGRDMAAASPKGRGSGDADERGWPRRFPVAERATDQCCRQASSNAAARWQGRLADHRRRRTFARAGSSGAGPGRSAGSSLAAHCGKRSSVRLPGSDRKCLTFLDLASLDNGTGGRDRSGSGHRL